MPRKRNLRMETYNKLINIGKSTEKDISNLKIEDLKEITKDPDVLNIIALREFIKEHVDIHTDIKLLRLFPDKSVST